MADEPDGVSLRSIPTFDFTGDHVDLTDPVQARFIVNAVALRVYTLLVTSGRVAEAPGLHAAIHEATTGIIADLGKTDARLSGRPQKDEFDA